jgi:membrane associated rhomboid family serine protease
VATILLPIRKYFADPNTGQQFAVPGLGPTLIPVYFTLISSMFMHGGIVHIAGNMLYLWIFGDNIENAWSQTLFIILPALRSLLH